MNSGTTSLSGNSKALGAFCNKVYCQCPRCSKKATITADLRSHIPLAFKNARLRCLNCAFGEEWSKGKLYGAVVGSSRERCPCCGNKWLTAEIEGKAAHKLRKSIAVYCPSCRQKANLTLRWRNEWRGNHAIDPYFGYPLWLRTECCGNTLWAYNEDHLSVLKSYIGATQRDGRNRAKWSMTARLPRWMTSTKNREAVLKCLNRIEDLLLDRS